MIAGADRYLRIDIVLKMTGLSRSTLYRKVNDGTFPRQIQLSERCIGWRLSDVELWAADPGGFRTRRSGAAANT